MKSSGLDEMQTQFRNRIGHQSFLLLLYLLLIDAGLFGFGFRWIAYPANIMLIVTFCSAIYLVRAIRAQAYVGPTAKPQRSLRKTGIVLILAATIAMAIFLLSPHGSGSTANHIGDAGAPVLFIASAIAIIITALTACIAKKQNKDDDN